MATKITIYENNSVVISSTMSTIISGFTGTFYVKKYASDTDHLIELSGTTSGYTVTFTLTTTHTNLTPGKYQYEIRITNGTHTYTTNKGEFVVLDSLATPVST